MAEAVLGETVHSMLAAWPSCRCARLLEWLVFTPIVLIWRALLASHALDWPAIWLVRSCLLLR